MIRHWYVDQGLGKNPHLINSLEDQRELAFHILFHSCLPIHGIFLDMLEFGKLVIIHPISHFLQGHFGNRHLQALQFFIDEKTET